MAGSNLGTALGTLKLNTNDLKNADLAIRSAGRGMLYFGIAATAAFAGIVNEAAKFEKEMDFVQAVTTATADEMRKLEQVALDLAKKTVFGPSELAQGFVELAKAGATVDQIINGVALATANLAQAADVDFAFAGENLLNIMNTFSLGAEEAARVSDLLAGAANASSVELDDIVTTMRYAGPVAATLGISIEDLNAAITALGLVGIKGSVAGTSLRFFMSRLVPDTKEAKDAIKELGLNIDKTTGAVVEFTDTEGRLLGLGEIFQVLKDRTKDMTQLQKADVINSLFGVRAMPTMLRLLEQGAEGFAELTGEINKTTAADVAAKRMDNLDGSIKQLKATLKAAMVEGASPLLDGLKEIVQFLTGMIRAFSNLPGPVKTFLIVAIGVVGVLSIMSALFLLTIGNIVRAARVSIELARAFRVVVPALRAFNVALLSSPIFWFIAAVIALGVAFYLLYTRVQGFRDFIDNLWQSMQMFWDDVTEGFGKAGKAIEDFFANFSFKNVISELRLTGRKFFYSLWSGFTEDEGGVFERFALKLHEWIVKPLKIGVLGFINGMKDLWKEIKRFGGDITQFFRDLGRNAQAALEGVVDGFSEIGLAVGRFFQELPGVVGRALQTALSAVVGFLAKLPGYFAYGLGLVIGIVIRTFLYEVPRIIIKSLIFLGKLVLKYLVIEQAKLWGRAFMLILRTVIEWGPKLLRLVWTILQGLFKVFLWLVIELPLMIGRMLLNIIGRFIGFLPELLSLGWQIVQGLFDVFLWLVWELPLAILGMLWDIITAFVGFLPEALSVAWDIVNGIFDVWLWLHTELPLLVWDIILSVGRKIGDAISYLGGLAKDLGLSIWNGIKDGLGIGSPSHIERAMDAITANARTNLHDLKNQVRKINAMSTRLPQYNAGTLGITPPGTAALNANGGGEIWNQNAPLIGQATIKDDRDVVHLARALERERRKEERAKGRSSYLAGAGVA